MIWFLCIYQNYTSSFHYDKCLQDVSEIKMFLDKNYLILLTPRNALIIILIAVRVIISTCRHSKID
jgi:hypothetical protein